MLDFIDKKIEFYKRRQTTITDEVVKHCQNYKKVKELSKDFYLLDEFIKDLTLIKNEYLRQHVLINDDNDD